MENIFKHGQGHNPYLWGAIGVSLHYTEFTDVQKMLEMGMDMMPVLQVGEQQYGFKEAIKIVGGM